MDSSLVDGRTDRNSGTPATSVPRVAVIGCGLIGRRRAQVIGKTGLGTVTAVSDLDPGRAATLASEVGSLAARDWREAVGRDDVDVVIVATTNDSLAPVARFALERGKHVLVEKPMARDPWEAETVMQAAEHKGLTLGVGFNHRHHRAVWKAHELFAGGAIGEILSIRCRYGHGGRPGYEREWRMNPKISGGGELLDQGVHAIDMFRWFLGDLKDAFGYVRSDFWVTEAAEADRRGTAAEDNAFALFRSGSGQVASLHASCTQWKNLFSFEVTGHDGYLVVEGLGGSYGPERLTWGRRRPESGPPDEELFEFPGPDESWEAEWGEFIAALEGKRQPLACGLDGWQAVKAVHAVYEASRTGRMVQL